MSILKEITTIVGNHHKNAEKYKKLVIVFGLVWFTVVIVLMIYSNRRDEAFEKENLNVQFTGVIEKVVYDVKQMPTVTVNQQEYYIGSGYNTNHEMKVGDSIFKSRGSSIYKLKKPGSNITIDFEK